VATRLLSDPGIENSRPPVNLTGGLLLIRGDLGLENAVNFTVHATNGWAYQSHDNDYDDGD
jgi:hypothetical protein